MSRTVERKYSQAHRCHAAYIYFFECGESELWPEWILMHTTVSLFFFESRIFRPRFPWKKSNRKKCNCRVVLHRLYFFPGKPRVVRAEKIKTRPHLLLAEKKIVRSCFRAGEILRRDVLREMESSPPSDLPTISQQEKKEIDILRRLRLQCR